MQRRWGCAPDRAFGWFLADSPPKTNQKRSFGGGVATPKPPPEKHLDVAQGATSKCFGPTIMNTPEITVDSSLRARLQQGHPWVYRNHVSGGEQLHSGQWVRVRCGGWVAYGLWDARSAIAVRLFSRQAVPDADWISERVWEASVSYTHLTLPTKRIV